ncbi:MarR family winged helix-turn-helix transcriptional regulator [Actinomadura scrupuli]|uniref:MarR family winged helix-turn-helix transcriptional regulator n=1 Tax=Actinomadura scrupuli TaxID=559629 RepID=UPI003D964067
MLPAEELRYLILAAQREGNRLLGRELKPLGVTSSQAEVLRILQERQPLTLSGLGDLLICESGNNPSRLVDRLTAAGLVDRRVAAHDRRHVELTLTEEGMRLAHRITEIENDLYRAIDAAADGRDLDEITGFLRAFVEGLPSGQALSRRIGTEQESRS